MPELPEVEVCRMGVKPHIEQQQVKQVVVRQKQLRWPVPDEVKSIEGQRVQAVDRRSKYLMLVFETGTVLVHLGMSGAIRVIDKQTPIIKHDHFDIEFNNGKVLRLNDPRRFGAVLWMPDHQDVDGILAKLGPEPLTEDFNAEYLYKKSRNRKMPIKNFLMNNQVVVGVGNIYANESLFKAGIHPEAQAGNVGKKRYESLTAIVKEVLAAAIKQGGTTLKDFTQTDGKPGYFAQELLVYGKAGKPCPTCQTPLMEVRQSNRSSVFCKTCQKK